MKGKFRGNFVVPLFVFDDDFESGNPLGSHAGKNKLGGIYFSIPCFPAFITSTLKNIFFSTLYYTDLSKFGNKEIFAHLIKELDDLSSVGLSIDCKGKKRNIYFQLGLILGDNKGLNSILGFTENFLFGLPCRICRAPLDEIKK